MPKRKYYNPQDDVVQIKDGKRVPVQAYDMYGEMHKGPKVSASTPLQQPAKPAAHTPRSAGPLSLRFDGENLTLIHAEGNKTTEYRFPAVSGRPLAGEDGAFDYSKERQRIKNVGPIPEGNHTLDLKTANYWKDAGVKQKIKSWLGGGEFPGGQRAWGEGHIDIKLSPEVVQETGRDGITIHGGSTPGSAGCIDLVDNDKAFFSKLDELKGDQTNIPLTVDYSKTPKKVWWRFGKKK